MNIIPASFEILPRDGERGSMATIELAARTCYKSEDRITDGSAEKLVRGLIRSGHTSVLEHGDYIFELRDPVAVAAMNNAVSLIAQGTGNAPRVCVTGATHRAVHRRVVSANVRTWRELAIACHHHAPICLINVIPYIVPYIDPAYLLGYEDMIGKYGPNKKVVPIRPEDLSPDEARSHLRQTVRFTIDRGISHEFVRHRVMSFSQESSRFCDYSQDKFSNQIAVIEPCFLKRGSAAYSIWADSCRRAEEDYFKLLDAGAKPEEARDVLPTSTKTELVMTGTLGQWDAFFDLRARQTTGRAHPQAVEVALPLMREFARQYPGIIKGDDGE